MFNQRVDPVGVSRYIKGLALAEIDNHSDSLSKLSPDSDQQGTLLVNIRDLRFNWDVWQLQAKQRIDADEPQKPQAEINVILMDLMADYPRLG